MRIEILCTGDEILSGKTINTNYSHMARRLLEADLDVVWGTTVGDDRESLLQAFGEASRRADAVIVNGGLGPTVDDLSQEVAAQAAGVPLELHEGWLARMEEFYKRRNRQMPAVNRKQAMLPQGSEMIDNPIGTACGFAVNIGKARFFFTPGVPRELCRMLDEQLMPRLLAMSGRQSVIRLKRFHSFGIGESRADEMLNNIEGLGSDVKLGFQAHYPELETKLAVRGSDEAEVARKLAPVEAEVRRRLGNFIIAEDDSTLESVVMQELRRRRATLATAEMFTSGNIAARIASLVSAEQIFARGVVARDLGQLCASCGLDGRNGSDGITPDLAVRVAQSLRGSSGAGLALAVLIALDDAQDGVEFGGNIFIGVADGSEGVARQARLLGGRDWVRLGAAELGLDCLRRHLQGLPVDERVDFERR